MPATLECKFPGCSFKTTVRSLIDDHHIIPRSMPGSSNKKNNRIFLCPEHHRCIYVPGASSGQHSVKHKDSIIIVDRRKSTQGEVLLFQKVSDEQTYAYYYRDGETWKM